MSEYDPLIRSDTVIPRGEKLEFRVVVAFDGITVDDVLDPDEDGITLAEFRIRMGWKYDDSIYYELRREGADHDVLDGEWFAAVDEDGALRRAKFESPYEKSKREQQEQGRADEECSHIGYPFLERYRDPWPAAGTE